MDDVKNVVDEIQEMVVMKQTWRTIVLILLAMILVSCNLPTGSMATPISAASADKLAPTPTSGPTETPAPSPTVALPTPTFPPQALVIDVSNAGRLTQTAQATLEFPSGIKWSADGGRIAVRTQGGLALLRSIDLSVEAVVNIQTPFFILDDDPDRAWIAVTADQKELQLRDIRSNAIIRSITSVDPFISAVFSPDGKAIALASMQEIGVSLWDTNSGGFLRTVRGFETAAPVYTMIFSPDGGYLVWISRGTVQLMDLATEKLQPALSHEDFVIGIALDARRQILVTSAGATVDDQFIPVIHMWNPFTGQELARIPAGKTVAASLALSPDGQLLAAGVDTTVLLWSLADRRQVAVLTGHRDAVNSVAFSPDGKTLASSSSDGTLRLWQVVSP